MMCAHGERCIFVTVTVKKMIEDGGYYDFSVLAGHAGLDTREVKTVCVIEDSAAAGAAAFGVKVDRFLGNIPKEVFRAATSVRSL